mgnify:CR=1 FL=1
MHSETQEHLFPFIIISTIVPNDTRIRVISNVSQTISFNCCKSMFQQYCIRMNKEKELVTIFKPLTELEQILKEQIKTAKKLRTMSLGKIYWIL